MKSSSRKILFVFSLLCFFIIAPAVSLYAIGYRFDFAAKSIKQTGMLILESTPKNAQIFINNKQIDEKTPAKIKNLLPGNYKIKIVKDGYYPWEKELSIKSQKTTLANNIILFFETLKIENLITHTAADFILTLDSEKLFYFVPSGDDKGIWLLNLKTKNEGVKIFPKDEDLNKLGNYENLKIDNLVLSPNNQKILFRILPQNYLVYDLTDNRTIFLSDLVSSKIENPKWNKDNNEKIYFANTAGLFQIDLKTKNVLQILTAKILDYEASSPEIFYLTKNDKIDNILLNKFEKNNQKDRREIKTLSKMPLSDNFVLKISPRKYFAYLDKNRGQLYLYDNNEQKIISDSAIKDFSWSRQGNKLLYFNENELWFYDIKNEETAKIEYKSNAPNLLTRLSSEIKNALFFGEEHVAFIQNNDAIKIIELDERGGRNVYEIKANPLLSKMFFNKDKTQIFFIDADSRNLKIAEVKKK
jgi:dipeptidyl aminopeptidase/acylaminoacyl peptidase